MLEQGERAMAQEPVELEALIDAVASAVISAQDKIEVYQAGLLSQYLDADRRPRTLDIRVPSNRLGAPPGEEMLLQVPILTLVGANRLAIESMEIKMDVDLGDIHDVVPKYKPPTDTPRQYTPPAMSAVGKESKPRRAMMVDMNSPRTATRDALGKVVLKVASQEPTEGIQRLMLELNKRIGVVAGPNSNPS
jgi:hypothetical protein